MSNQLSTFSSLENTENFSLIPPNVEAMLDQIINIEKTSQFDSLGLTTKDCEIIINHLDQMMETLINNTRIIERLTKLRPEYIPITLSDETFI
jgi:hypothetical protein